MQKAFLTPGSPRRLSMAAALVWVALARTTTAHAQAGHDDASRAVARQLGVEGIEAYQRNDFPTAEQKLERAYRLFPAPTLGLFSARARAKRGLWVEAAERYRQATLSTPEIGDSAAQKAAQNDANQELEALLPRIPTMTVLLEGAPSRDVTITFDNGPYANDLIGMARPTNPGTHRLQATRGGDRIEQAVTLAEKETKTVVLRFQQPAPSAAVASVPQQPPVAPSAVAASAVPEPAPRSHGEAQGSMLWPLGIAAVSVGAASLVTWGVSSLIADGQLNKCGEMDGERWCDTEGQAASYRTAKTVSMVSFWTGATLAVGGAGLLLWNGRERSNAQSLSVSLTPTGAALRGAF